jgi:hypothetical protein
MSSPPAPHPIIDQLVRLLEPGTAEPLVLPASAKAALMEAVRSAGDTAQRAEAVLSLFHVAIALSEEENSPSAAKVVLEALHELRAELDLTSLGDDGALQKQLDAGLAHGTKRAPRLGEKAPEGSLKVGALTPLRFKP